MAAQAQPVPSTGTWSPAWFRWTANPDSLPFLLDLGDPRDSEEQRIRWLHVLKKLMFLMGELCLPRQDCPWASLHWEIFQKLLQKGFRDALCDLPSLQS